MPTFTASDYSKDLECAICLEIWNDPTELRPCQHIFCRECVTTVRDCPECRARILSRDKPNRTLINVADNVPVTCNECGWKGTRESSRYHTECNKSSRGGSSGMSQAEQQEAMDAFFGGPTPSNAPRPAATTGSRPPQQQQQQQGFPPQQYSAQQMANNPYTYNPQMVNNQSQQQGPPARPQPQQQQTQASPVRPSPSNQKQQPPYQQQQQQSSPVRQGYPVQPGYPSQQGYPPAQPQQGPYGSGSYYTSPTSSNSPNRSNNAPYPSSGGYGPKQPPAGGGGRPPQQAPPPSAPLQSITPPENHQQPWTLYNLCQEEYDQIFSIFIMFDNDDSGELDRYELGRLARCLNYARTDTDIDNIFRSMDVDGSGSLNMNEFCTWLKYHKPNPQALYGLSQYEYNTVLLQFQACDVNQTGSIALEPFVRMCLSNGYTNSRQEAVNLFRAIDADHSGAIDLHEYLKYQQRHRLQ